MCNVQKMKRIWSRKKLGARKKFFFFVIFVYNYLKSLSLILNKFYCFLKPTEKNKFSLENFNIHKKSNAVPLPYLIFYELFYAVAHAIHIFEYRGLTENWTAEMITHHKRTNLSREKRVGQRKGRLKGSITCKSPSMNPSRKQFQFYSEVHSGEQLNEHPPTHFFLFLFPFFSWTIP